MDEQSQQLLKAIQDTGVLPAHVKPERALSNVVCILSRRLTRGEAAHVVKSLPQGLEPLLNRCIVGRDERGDIFDRDMFLRQVAAYLSVSERRAEDIAAAVLGTVKNYLSAEEVENVASQLPKDLHDFWCYSSSAA